MVKKGQKRRTISLPRSLSHLQDHRAALFVAMIEYLRRLEWPSTGGHNRVTLIILALDFGVYSGLDLPPIQRGLPFTAASLADRARRFRDMLATLEFYRGSIQIAPITPQIAHAQAIVYRHWGSLQV